MSHRGRSLVSRSDHGLVAVHHYLCPYRKRVLIRAAAQERVRAASLHHPYFLGTVLLGDSPHESRYEDSPIRTSDEQNRTVGVKFHSEGMMSQRIRAATSASIVKFIRISITPFHSSLRSFCRCFLLAQSRTLQNIHSSQRDTRIHECANPLPATCIYQCSVASRLPDPHW
jgi:hypothetical protein